MPAPVRSIAPPSPPEPAEDRPGILSRIGAALGLVYRPRLPEAPREEHEAALEECRALLEAAQAAVEHAREAYDQRGDEATEAALLEALEVARVADERFERAARLRARALDREAEDRRAELEAKRDEIAAALMQLESERVPLAQVEVEALERAAEVRAARYGLEQRIRQHDSELRRAERELGVPESRPSPSSVTARDLEPSWVPVAEALEQRARSAAEPLSRYLHALARGVREFR